MQKMIVYTGVFLLSFIIADSVLAEMVTFSGRWIVDRSNITSVLSPVRETPSSKDKIRVIIHVVPGISGWEFRFSCEDNWDFEKVKSASKSIANYINKNNDIDPFKMLSDAGLSGCKVEK